MRARWSCRRVLVCTTGPSSMPVVVRSAATPTRIAIAHREDGRYIVDVVRGRSGPFEPVELTKEYAALCQEYRVTSVTGDNYALEWIQSAWRNSGVSYVKSELTASELYLEASAAVHALARGRCPTIRCCCASCACWSAHRHD